MWHFQAVKIRFIGNPRTMYLAEYKSFLPISRSLQRRTSSKGQDAHLLGFPPKMTSRRMNPRAPTMARRCLLMMIGESDVEVHSCEYDCWFDWTAILNLILETFKFLDSSISISRALGSTLSSHATFSLAAHFILYSFDTGSIHYELHSPRKLHAYDSESFNWMALKFLI